eukprot:3983418-Heterocapsa_arctica.AAC.1
MQQGIPLPIKSRSGGRLPAIGSVRYAEGGPSSHPTWEREAQAPRSRDPPGTGRRRGTTSLDVKWDWP